MDKPRYQSLAVSIHARHYWRASLDRKTQYVSDKMFQSTPAITGERAGSTARLIGPASPFQSTPAITGERAGKRQL